MMTQYIQQQHIPLSVGGGVTDVSLMRQIAPIDAYSRVMYCIMGIGGRNGLK